MTDETYRVTADELPQYLSVDATTGDLSWNVRPQSMFCNKSRNASKICKTWNARFANKPAGYRGADGYERVSIKGFSYKSHRVVFAICNGRWPSGDIDHINGVKSDNRLENLREVTHAENCRNQKLKSTSSTGIPGTSLDRRTGKYIVSITYSGARRHIGQYSNVHDAKIARSAAERALNFHENHGRRMQ